MPACDAGALKRVPEYQIFMSEIPASPSAMAR
jgi:hypothetical protein